jgi:hypothetical protein
MAALETTAAVAMIAADVTSTFAAAAVVNAVAVALMTALVVVAMWADCSSAFSVARAASVLPAFAVGAISAVSLACTSVVFQCQILKLNKLARVKIFTLGMFWVAPFSFYNLCIGYISCKT